MPDVVGVGASAGVDAMVGAGVGKADDARMGGRTNFSGP